MQPEDDSPVKLPIGITTEPRLVPGSPEWDDFLQAEWDKPLEFSFTNAAGQVFYEIACSRQDVNTFAKMHEATSYKPTAENSISKSSLDD
jgi:hypothetical protein